MGYRHFRLHVTGRVLLIAFTLFLCLFCYFQTRFYMVTLLLALLPIWQTWSLLNYVQRTNRQLTQFFDTLEAAAFSDRLPSHFDNSGFRELSLILNRIIASLADNRAEKEQQLRFFQSVIQKMGVGLIAVRTDGVIEFMNRSARRMLKVPPVDHTRQLDQIIPGLADRLNAVESGQRKWISVNDDGRKVQLAIFAQQIHMPQQGGYKLLTLQNLQAELEDRESDAWKDLIRVLSHEIMNSMTPISSLANTALNLIPKKSQDLTEYHSDLIEALKTIRRRSQGLMQFVNNYRRFATIPVPRRQPFPIEGLFERLRALIQNQLTERSIVFESRIEPANLKIFIDPSLMEQVFLNILTNSMDALDKTSAPKIRLTASADHRARVSIHVSDNGRGMDDAILDKIFIPFFTTKTHGSGVGLSISRQIMRQHGGTLQVQSAIEQGTTVTLMF